MPDGRTGACVALGLERRDPTTDHRAVRLVERLDRPHAHVGASLPREREHRIKIAERVERFAREQQRDLFYIDHPPPRIDPLVGRAADVDEKRYGESPPSRPDIDVETVIHRGSRALIDQGADARRQVELIAIALLVETRAPRPQALESLAETPNERPVSRQHRVAPRVVAEVR